MAWLETPNRVVVEFLRSNKGMSRVIALKHSPSVIPPQLIGRVDPNLWSSFMTDVQQAASQHPYTAKPTAKNMGYWGGCFLIGSVLGIFCVNPDAGDYATWEAQVQDIVRRYGPAFSAAGCTLHFKRNRDFYIEIVVNPNYVVGEPVQLLPPKADKI